MSEIKMSEHAVEVVKSADRFTTTTTKLPIGSIIAYYPPGKITLPVGWELCAGQKIKDSESPLFGFKAPSLSDERFLIGSKSDSIFGNEGGVNARANIGPHNHGGATGVGGGNRRADNDDDFNASTARHAHSISEDGAHDHRAENRPQFFGVLFLIKTRSV